MSRILLTALLTAVLAVGALGASPFAVRSRRMPELLSADESPLRVAGARWMRLRFEGCSRAAGGVALRDSSGARQLLKPRAGNLASQWSAFFNSDQVFARLQAGGESSGCRAESVEFSGGMQRSAPVGLSAHDSRQSYSSPIVLRLLVRRNAARWFVCSAFLHSSGWWITAGHCARGLQIAEQNPPASAADGELRFAPPQRQWSIDSRSIRSSVAGPGADWAIFRLGAPLDASAPAEQFPDGLHSVEQLPVAGAAIRVPGFGGDALGVGQSPGAAHHSLRAASGQFRGGCGRGLEYSGIFTEGMSGAPALDENGAVFAIHTHGLGPKGCGTSLREDNLRRALAQPY
ncbi:MAG: serine protease [Leptospirales bacterium]|nr:serine protease [Leptospirales bacterium]